MHTARSTRRASSSRNIHAPDRATAREQLRVRGLLAQNLTELPATGEQSVRTAFKKIKPKSLQIFSRQFATMIDAGLSVVSALVVLEEQTDDKYLAGVISELRADVEGGLLLSQAMGRHPKIFSRLYIAMVEAGEAAGILDAVLDRVAFPDREGDGDQAPSQGRDDLPDDGLDLRDPRPDRDAHVPRPDLRQDLPDLGGELPTLTQWVVNVSDFLRGNYYIVFPVLIASFFGLRKAKRTEKGKQVWDRLKLKIPMKIGAVVLKVTMASFSRTLSTLIAAGVDIIKAPEITGQTAGNWVVEEALADVRNKVQEGIPIASRWPRTRSSCRWSRT